MNFEQIIKKAQQGTPKRFAVAAAEDIDVLSAVSEAAKLGLVEPVLVGDSDKICSLIKDNSLKSLENAKIVATDSLASSAETAVKMVSSGQADVLMKGLLGTATLLKAVLNKEWGLRTGSLLSHIGLIQSPAFDRIFFMTDAAMVMYPDLKQKADLINNAVKVARAMGVDTPNVACIAAVEVINPDMPATLDAAALALMNQRGQIKNCVVDGPLALDNAVSAEAAKHKGISSPVAGKADILLVPNIETGNAFYKACAYLGGCEVAGLLAGAAAPIVLTSRADSSESKLRSIACAAAASSK